MIHANTIYDSDTHFVIDPVTRAIHNDSGKLVLIRGDHNSERYTFEIPRTIEGHDMSECSVVQIHYENLSKNKKFVNRDFYTVDDLQISSENNETVLFSWLVSDASTQLVGTLRFSVRFECLTEDGVREYVWNTAYFDKILVNDCIYSTDSVLVEHSDFVSRVESVIDKIPTRVSQLDNDKGYLTEYTEKDPTVGNWAKEKEKPSYSASEISYGESTLDVCLEQVSESIPSDTHINELINQAMGVIENGSY